MCDGDAYDKYHVSIHDGAISDGVRPMTITLSKEALFSVGHTINFIDN